MAKGDRQTCEFTKACTNPGPVTRLDGTPKHFCLPHKRVMQAAALAAPISLGFDLGVQVPRTARGGRRRSSWLQQTGVVGF